MLMLNYIILNEFRFSLTTHALADKRILQVHEIQRLEAINFLVNHMASASTRHGGAGSSKAAPNFKGKSSSVECLGREMLQMRLRDSKLDRDDDEVTFQLLLLFLLLVML